MHANICGCMCTYCSVCTACEWLSCPHVELQVYVHVGHGACQSLSNSTGIFRCLWSRGREIAWAGRSKVGMCHVICWECNKALHLGSHDQKLCFLSFNLFNTEFYLYTFKMMMKWKCYVLMKIKSTCICSYLMLQKLCLVLRKMTNWHCTINTVFFCNYSIRSKNTILPCWCIISQFWLHSVIERWFLWGTKETPCSFTYHIIKAHWEAACWHLINVCVSILQYHISFNAASWNSCHSAPEWEKVKRSVSSWAICD